MKTVKDMIAELTAAKESGVSHVTYGESDSDLGTSVQIDDAIADISEMDDEMIGDGIWCAMHSIV